MAGIGFTLRKLSTQDNLSGTFAAYLHSALIAAGPWILTILALGSSVLICNGMTSRENIDLFRIVLIYNFSFSMIFTAPICMVATRFLADQIYKKDLSQISGLLLGTLFFVLATQIPIATIFYLGYAKLPLAIAINAIINFQAIACIWLVTIFLSTLKNYSGITRAFALGLFSGTFACSLLASSLGGLGMLLGFNLGVLAILFLLLGQVLGEYPQKMVNIFAFLPCFKRYWEVALGSFLYSLACWVDKWILWFSPEAPPSPFNMPSYPHYDAAMFLANLTAIPSLSAFVFRMETQFFDHYQQFYHDIQRHATLDRIQENLGHLIATVMDSARTHILVMGSLITAAILSAHQILEFLQINLLQLGAFRFGVLGTFFHTNLLFLLITLAYFDQRRLALKIQILFLLLNTSFTLLSLKGGFPYYGLGYCLACIGTFLPAAWVSMKHIQNLPYHTFITTNDSVRYS